MALNPTQHTAYNSVMAGVPNMDVWMQLATDGAVMPVELSNHLGLHERSTFAAGAALLQGRTCGHAVY
jgi:hypothetical protein